MWSVDFKKLLKNHTPKWLRQSLYLLVLFAATWPVRQKYNEFVLFVNNIFYRLRHNSQVCYLRKVLNDKCDSTQRRILVVDYEGIQGLYLWADEDLRDVDFGDDRGLWPDDMIVDSGIDFTVRVPLAIINTQPEIAYLKSNVNEYKMGGKTYNIVKY
jgi:hypothetical protein